MKSGKIGEQYLHDINGRRVSHIREQNLSLGISDCLNPLYLLHVLEGGVAIDHLIENAAEGPDITWFTHLHMRERDGGNEGEKYFRVLTVTDKNNSLER